MSGRIGASEVAAAFFAGKKLTRGNHNTDGETYWLFGNAIARRCEDTRTIAEKVAGTLLSEWHRPAFEFTFAGWPTVTTCGALDTLGLRASKAGGTPRINGHVVDCSTWYTLKMLESLPTATLDELINHRRREAREAIRAEKERVHALTEDMFA